MHNSVSFDDLSDQSSDFLLVHGPDLIESVLITLYEPLKLVLKLLELDRKLFIVFSQLHILLLVEKALRIEFLLNSS